MYEGILYRDVKHVTPGTKFYNALQQHGNVIELESHMGCSRSGGTSTGFSGGVCLMRIATTKGKSIEAIGGYHSERENILEKGTRYKVVGVAHNITSGGEKVALFVDLEETDETAHHKIALSAYSLWEIPQDPR